MRVRLAIVAVLALLIARCAMPPPSTNVPTLDQAYFEAKVEPELIASCAFSTCHGAPLRPMRVFSLAGLRIDPSLTSNQPLTPEEHFANYKRASLAAAATSSTLPELLRKPLQIEQGGAGHGGVDRFGQNIYANKTANGWKLLEAWVNGATYDGGTDPMMDGGFEDDGGVPMDPDGGVVMACMPRPGVTYDQIAAIVTKVTCAKEAGCHTPENRLDAGCFVADDTCGSLRMAGCVRPSVIPCDLFRSKLLQYTGQRPFGVKSHQGVLLPIHAQAIAEWIDAGASCDGGGFFP
ncbi:MAG: hypothetical protein JNM17_16380 [Archangium sp.]|nr:hypothetical protein [Archangium sp.]